MSLEALMGIFLAGFLLPFQVVAAVGMGTFALVIVSAIAGVLGVLALYPGLWLPGKTEDHARFSPRRRTRR